MNYNDELARELHRCAERLCEGLVPAPPAGRPAAAPVLTSDADLGSPVPSRFRLPMSHAASAYAIFQRFDEDPGEASYDLFEICTDIVNAIHKEMGDVENREQEHRAYMRMAPARRAWVILESWDNSAAFDGVSGTLKSLGPEMLVVVAAVRHFGQAERAEAIDRIIAQFPKQEDGFIDWFVRPIPEGVPEAIAKGGEQLSWHSAVERMEYALSRPELFFTNAADAFVPEPLKGAGEKK